MCICPQLTHGSYVQNMETSSIEGLDEVLVYETNLDIGSIIPRCKQILSLKTKMIWVCNASGPPLAEIVLFGFSLTGFSSTLKTHPLGKGFHTLIKGVSFSSPTNVRYHRFHFVHMEEAQINNLSLSEILLEYRKKCQSVTCCGVRGCCRWQEPPWYQSPPSKCLGDCVRKNLIALGGILFSTYDIYDEEQIIHQMVKQK